MRYVLSIVTLAVLTGAPVRAAGDISGTWMSDTQTFVFKVKGDTFTGLVCGRCDDPTDVFRIEEGKLPDADRATFAIRHDDNTADRVTATLVGNRLTLKMEQRKGAANASTTTVLRRVVENGVSVVSSSGSRPKAADNSAVASAFRRKDSSPIEGKWVANGRRAQQNFVLKVRDNKVWGLVCGPCDPDGVFLIDDGAINGDNVTFYINHIDTPPSPQQTGLRRNIMRGARVDNVMKFKWVREGAENEPGGEMILIGPIRSW